MVCQHLCQNEEIEVDNAVKKGNAVETSFSCGKDHGRLPCCLLSGGQGANVDAQDDKGITALMHAVLNDHESCVQVLCDLGADVNIVDRSGKSALTHAVRLGNNNIFRKLIDSKADVNVQDKAGKTALMYTCEMKKTSFCYMLVAQKCNLNQQDGDRKTGLIYAILAKAKEICSLLVNNGADLNLQDKYGLTALMYAAKDGSGLCRDVMTKNTNLNLADKKGMTVLMHAASMFHLNTCQFLLQSRNIDLTFRDNNDMTVLMIVINKIVSYSTLYYDKINDALKIAEMLINNGADLVFDKDSKSILEMESRFRCGLTLGNLIRRGSSGLVRLLIANGIMDAEFDNPEIGQRPFRSVIECAASFNRHDVLAYCFDKCYLTIYDLDYIRRAGKERTQHTERKCIALQDKSAQDTCSLDTSCETDRILLEASSSVWSLYKLAFITVSTSLGISPDRDYRIAKTPLPPQMQRKLMFKDKI